MFKSYFKIAYRNLMRNKVSSVVNIGGLTVGIAVAFLIGLWIYDELSFNKYHKNYSRIGRILTRGIDPKEGGFINNSLPYPLGTELETNYKSEFKHLVKASWAQEYILAAGDKKLSRKGQFMEKDAPEMLTLKMTKGDWSGLNDPHSILLSASTAKALFGDINPMGKQVTMNNKTEVVVTGVYEDLPLNTEFNDLKFFSSWELWVSQNDWIKERALNDWNNHFFKIYAEIKPGSSFAKVNKVIREAEMQKIKAIDKYKEEASRNPEVFLFPMSDWHLNVYERDSAEPGKGPLKMVWMVTIIGIFVLVLACINFMNLSTARSEKRAREVGIRKAIGSMRKQIIYQFFGETFLVVIISFFLASILVLFALPWFNNLSNKEMNIPWTNPYFWLISLAFISVTGLLAGSYPALYLSSFKPVKVLKGLFRAGHLAAIPRKALVVMQFTISLALIICTIIINRQVQIGKNRPVGYDREGLIMLEMKSEDFAGKYNLLRNELLQTGVVANLSESMGKVTEVASGNNGFDWKGRDPNKEESFGTLAVTPEHGKTIGWQFVAGRDFSGTNITDSMGVVINEAAARYMELKNPVGETITWKWFQNPPVPYTILGVIRNAVMESPYESIEPTLFFVKALNGGVSWINIRIQPGVPVNTALSTIGAAMKKLVPGAPFDYKFVDEDYALKFAKEERIARLVGFFAVFAIFISCLGLFGLASYMAEQRTKEIGVRKILGASILRLWLILSTGFLGWISLSLLIASPIAYYFMDHWLQDYQYRTAMSWWIFGAAGAGALLVTLLTVSFQTLRTAYRNPVNSLRNE